MPNSIETMVIQKAETLEQQTNHTPQTNIKVYKTRWVILFLLTACSACTAFHFLQFSIIANIIVEFYGVSYEAVDWSAMIPLVLYTPSVLIAMYIMSKIEIRTSILIGIFGVCAASWIKVGSAAPDRFWVVLTAQTIVAFFQVFVSVLPARVAAAWFGVEQTALACGIGLFGNQLGIMLGCFIPTILVKYSKERDAVAHDMTVLNIGFAIICTLTAMLTFALFKSEPPTPPSNAQKQLHTTGKLDFKDSTRLLFKNNSYVLFLVAYAISMGVFYTIPTLLNQIILQYYPDSLEEVGRIGLILNIMGMLSSAVSGYILGKLSRYYRVTTICTFILFLVGMILFTLTPLHSLRSVYIATIVLGFFMTATFSICLEVAAELTYPVPENFSTGYLNAASQLVAIGFVYLYSFLLYNFGALWSNVATCVELFISSALVAYMKFNLRRQAAEELHIKSVQT